MRIFVFILTCFVVQLWSHSFGSWCGEGNRRYITDSGLIQPILTWEIAAPSCQTLIYADEKLIEQRNDILVARTPVNGDSLWVFNVGEPCYYPATNGEVVIVPTKRKYYYCLDVESGSLLWSDSTTSTIATHALTYGNKILLGDEQGEFHRIEGNNEIDVTVTLKDVILGSTPCFLNSLLIQSAKPLSCTVFEIPGGDYVLHQGAYDLEMTYPITVSRQFNSDDAYFYTIDEDGLLIPTGMFDAGTFWNLSLNITCPLVLRSGTAVDSILAASNQQLYLVVHNRTTRTATSHVILTASNSINALVGAGSSLYCATDDSLYALSFLGKRLWTLPYGAQSLIVGDSMLFTIDYGTLRAFGEEPPNAITSQERLQDSFILYQNYPNPFNPSTKIRFTLPKPEQVKIDIYNNIGQKVKTLLNKSMPACNHEVDFNAITLPSGIYFYRIQAGEFQDAKKMILLK